MYRNDSDPMNIENNDVVRNYIRFRKLIFNFSQLGANRADLRDSVLKKFNFDAEMFIDLVIFTGMR